GAVATTRGGVAPPFARGWPGIQASTRGRAGAMVPPPFGAGGCAGGAAPLVTGAGAVGGCGAAPLVGAGSRAVGVGGGAGADADRRRQGQAGWRQTRISSAIARK